MRQVWFPLTVLLVGATATTFVTVQLKRAIDAQDTERFESAVDGLQDNIRDRTETYIAMLRAGAGLLEGEALPSVRDFHAFTQRLELPRRYPGIQGIGFSARIPADDLDEVVSAQQRGGSSGFHVWPEQPRDEYHAILYLEPLDRRNGAAIGFDMFTDPTRRAAMERARDTGEPAASGPVTLVQEIDEDKQAGFLIYMPVYEGGSVPDTLAGRRELLRGFVYSPFRAGDLFTGILGRNPRPRAGFQLFDGTPSDETLLYRTGAAGDTGRFTTTRTIDVAGRRWTATIYSLPALESSSSLGLVRFVAWGGSLITILLTAAAWLQVRARNRAEESEAAAEAASKSLQAQSDTLGILNRTGAQLASELDIEPLLQSITNAATRLASAQFGAYYNSDMEAGAAPSYSLSAVSGVSRDGLAEFAMPRPAVVFGRAVQGEGLVRSGDIGSDPAYRRGACGLMTDGHLPIRSYLAVPVRSRSGDVLGGLVFGHADPGVFTAQTEELVAGVAAHAAVAIDNARLYGEVQRLLASERTARAEAERISGLKDEFLATLSHELRTPLNAVIGWAHMLNSGRLTDQKRQSAAEAILRNALVQSHLVEDLLDMSRIISGRLHMEVQDVDMHDIVRAAFAVVQPTADAKRITLHSHGEPAACRVRGDADRLQQVLWNLLTNAIKFTPSGGRVDVRLQARGDQVEIAVSDSGIGIERDFLPHVFERFRQADGSYTRAHGGLGLGLSIVKSLVEMHAGEVHAESEGIDRGATFTVSLPRAGETAAGGLASHRLLKPSTSDEHTLRGLSVLVVDDEEDARELAAEVLVQHGAIVRTASSGIQALRLLQSDTSAVDLLISDLAMPQMDGYELIRRIRALPVEASGTAPAIALTAYAGADDRRRVVTAGYNLHLAKPFTPAQLAAACLQLTERKEGSGA